MKYKTRTYQAADLNGEIIRTRHIVRDVGRHSYLKDIERIENYSCVNGFERVPLLLPMTSIIITPN